MKLDQTNDMTNVETEITVSPPDSLAKYEAPLFVGIEPSVSHEEVKAKATLNNTKLEDMVDSIIPPREWVEESGAWMQHISKEPATRLDVITLQENLDGKLTERKARETGICPVREELYSQCMVELIRQVSLDSPERGLLLMRTRDEVNMTIDAYKTLYSSSVTFGIKKQLKAEQGIPALEETLQELEDTNSKLEVEVQELRSKLEIIEKRESERRLGEEKKRKEELDFLKYQGQHLDSFLKQMNASK